MADKIASMMAAGWVSIPEVKWDAMKARAARATVLEEALRKIRRWGEAWGPDLVARMPPDDLAEYMIVLDAAGLSMSRLNGELIRRIVLDIDKIAAEALGDAAPPELAPEEDAADLRLARMARWGLPP